MAKRFEYKTCREIPKSIPEISDDNDDDDHEKEQQTLLPYEKDIIFLAPSYKMHIHKPSPEINSDETTKNISSTTINADDVEQHVAQNNTLNSPISDVIRSAAAVTTNTTTISPSIGKAGYLQTDNTTNNASSPQQQLHVYKQSKRKSSARSAEPPHAQSNTDDDETDVIGDLVGHYGKWQFLMTLLLSLFQVPNTFHISSSVYQGAHKQFWCKRPPHLQEVDVGVWRNLSQSQDNCFQAYIDWHRISNNTSAQQQLQENTTRISCSAWEYENDDNVGNTWTSEWDLVCDKEYLINVAEMFFLLGVATGGIISGFLSDKFGRKKMLFISAVLQTTFGLALYFVTSFELYLTLRALLGLVSVSVTYSALILAIECVDGKWRTIAGMYNLFPLPISYMLISGIAYLTQDYQRLQLCIGIPGIFLCFLWFVVPESPRWLLVKGRVDEVKRIVQSAADFNGRQLPPNFQSMLKPPTQENTSQDIMSLFRSRYLRRISICFLCIWFTMNLVYYGLILNMSSFGGNVYLNSALAGLVEIPAIAIAIYIITKVGKKWLFCATFICASVACLFATITEGLEELLWLKITFLMIGKFTISAGNTIMPVYTAELYPTAIRNVGVGACNVAAGIALIITPYLSLLTKIQSHLLMLLLTLSSLFGGIVVSFLPESMLEHTINNPTEEKC
ncbi:organic cation transporter protein isoform X2 [Teleopsis dalmanni]|uniref:organic cation transporter protein isoform X2 n=1 Tax=Teleopsis dalmanni TaxID=139649 RepID=UPI0018CD3DCE|nr:organic cation transporter protein isoform X2 [Teleopsis dalmanni]